MHRPPGPGTPSGSPLMSASSLKTVAGAVKGGRQPSVAIIGGGVAAFTAALSLHRAGVNNRMYVPESKLGHSARSAMFIGGSAVRILDRLGLGTEYRLLGSPVFNVQVVSVQSAPIASFKLDGLGSEVWIVPRDFLLQRFVEAIPLESVQFSSKLRALRIRPSSIQIELQRQCPSGSLASPTEDPTTSIIDADYVIGADGFTSLVRTFMSRPALTIPSGVTVWRAVVRHTALDKLPFHIAKEVWDNDIRFGYVRVTKDQVMWWAIGTDLNDVILRPFLPRLRRMFRHFPSPVASLLDAVESDRHIYRQEMKRVWPQYIPWVDNISLRIGLVGDAARPGTAESFHTGHSFAINDSYILANVLVEDKDNGFSLEHDTTDEESPLLRYARNRAAHLHAFHKLSAQIDQLTRSRSVLHRYFTKRRLQNAVNRAIEGMSTIISSSTLLR